MNSLSYKCYMYVSTLKQDKGEQRSRRGLLSHRNLIFTLKIMTLLKAALKKKYWIQLYTNFYFKFKLLPYSHLVFHPEVDPG